MIFWYRIFFRIWIIFFGYRISEIFPKENLYRISIRNYPKWKLKTCFFEVLGVKYYPTLRIEYFLLVFHFGYPYSKLSKISDISISVSNTGTGGPVSIQFLLGKHLKRSKGSENQNLRMDNMRTSAELDRFSFNFSQ